MLRDKTGIPVSFLTAKANVHDNRLAIPTIKRLRIGKRRCNPKRLRADKGYDSAALRAQLRTLGIKPALDARIYARRKGSPDQWNDRAEIRYGRNRYQVEQRIAGLTKHRRRCFLYEWTRAVYEEFVILAFIRKYLKMLTKCRK